MRRSLFLALGMAVACNNGSDTSPYADSSLEIPSVTLENGVELAAARQDLGGVITVSGTAPNLTVNINTDNGGTEVTVKAPGLPDLSAIEGIEGMLSLAEDPLTDKLSVMISDAEGPLYLLETVDAGPLTTSAFGPGFAGGGGSLGDVGVGLDTLTLYGIDISTDDGVVELFPGEPQEILVDGVSYRAVVVASFSRFFNAQPTCNFLIEDIRSFELTRVEAGTADLTPLTRPEGARIEGPFCPPAAATG